MSLQKNRIIISIFTVFILIACLLLCLTACDGSQSSSSYMGKYYEYSNNVKDPNSWIELKVGFKWSDGDDSGTYKVTNGIISLMIDGEEIMSGTISNGVMVLDFLGMETTYKKDGASGSNGGTQGPQAVDNQAKVTGITGGSVDGLVVSLEVGPTVSYVDLSGMLSVSKNSSWQLYEDITGQVLIPTKYAANLSDGNNTYYIVVNSSDDKINRTYTLNIWKNYYADVYYYANEILFDVQENVASHTYLEDFRAPSVEGYTFKGWGCEGYYIESHTIRFDANLEANDYTVTLDADGGNCSYPSKTVTYDESYTLPVPTKEGYTFNGWESGYDFITTANGNGIGLWKTASDVTATAQWTANQYDMTVQADTSGGGTASDAGTHSYYYGTSHTVTASTNSEYVFIGWYQGSEKVEDSLSFTYTVPAYGTTYTAKWIACPITLNKSSANAGSVSGMNGKYVLGQSTTITATTNNGYTWLGWYDGNTKVSTGTSDSYTFTMTDESKTYTAKWCKVTITQNNSSYGQVSSLNATYVPGDTVEITATSNNGSTWLGWYDGDTKVSTGTSKSYTFTMPSENKTYTAKWSHIEYDKNYANAGNIGGLNTAFDLGEAITVSATNTNLGYIWLGWFNGDTKVSIADSTSYSFAASSDNISLTAKWQIDEALSGFTFTSTPTTCKITGVTDTNITSVNIPNMVTSIGERAFYECSELTEITIPDSVISIGDYAFYNCSGLTGDIAIPDGVTRIGYNAFMNCSGLTSITIPNSVTSIGDAAFMGCSGLTGNIAIPDGVTRIGWGTFSGCSSLTSITIPDNVAKIEQEAFYNCSGLTTVNWNATACTSAGGSDSPTFQNCTNLTTVNIGDNVTTIPAFAFYGCGGLQYNEYDNAYYLGNDNNPYLWLIKAKSKDITSCDINQNTKGIDMGAFSGCSRLTSVTIPNSVMNIGYRAFYNCTSLQYNEYDNAYYLGNDNNPYVVLITAKSITSCTINKDTKVIYNDAFSGCSGLTSITIPNHVTSIGANAFRNCRGLTSITIPDSVTSIGSYAFYGCSGLKSVTIPDSVASIDYGTFEGCSNLTSVTIGNGVTSINGNTFNRCSNISSITISANVTNIGFYAFANCSGLTIIYQGTMAQWHEIIIDAYWCVNTENFTIHCIDGDMQIQWMECVP